MKNGSWVAVNGEKETETELGGVAESKGVRDFAGEFDAEESRGPPGTVVAVITENKVFTATEAGTNPRHEVPDRIKGLI